MPEDRGLRCECFVPLGHNAEHVNRTLHTTPGGKRLQTERFYKDGDRVFPMGGLRETHPHPPPVEQQRETYRRS